MSRGETCRVLLRNYRKDGSLFWNEMTVMPLRHPDGCVTHFASHHRDAGERLRIDPKSREGQLERRSPTDGHRGARRSLDGPLHTAVSRRIAEARLGGRASRATEHRGICRGHRCIGSLQHDLRARRGRFNHSPRGAYRFGMLAPLERCHGAHRRRQLHRICAGPVDRAGVARRPAHGRTGARLTNSPSTFGGPALHQHQRGRVRHALPAPPTVLPIFCKKPSSSCSSRRSRGAIRLLSSSRTMRGLEARRRQCLESSQRPGREFAPVDVSTPAPRQSNSRVLDCSITHCMRGSDWTHPRLPAARPACIKS